LRKHFERLMELAKQHNFHQSFSQVYFVNDKSIRRFFDSNKPDEILRKDIFTFEDYENQFDELLNQGHSWLNLSFVGIVKDSLLIIIELPKYKNNASCKSISINLSLPNQEIIEKNWNVSSFMKII
jgi:hypothetical protein